MIRRLKHAWSAQSSPASCKNITAGGVRASQRTHISSTAPDASSHFAAFSSPLTNLKAAPLSPSVFQTPFRSGPCSLLRIKFMSRPCTAALRISNLSLCILECLFARGELEGKHLIRRERYLPRVMWQHVGFPVFRSDLLGGCALLRGCWSNENLRDCLHHHSNVQ